MREIRQREPRLEIPALTKAVRDFPCTLEVPGVCWGFREGCIVWCHSNKDRHGKGKGLKAHDCFGAAGCTPCHRYVDTHRGPEVDEIMQRGRDRTLYLLFERGKLKVVT